MSRRFKSPHAHDRQNFERLVKRTGSLMVKHLDERPTMPVDSSLPPREIREELANLPLTAKEMTADEILSLLENKVMPFSMPTNHPRSYGWVSSSPAPISILSNALATTLDNGLSDSDHAGTYLMQSLGR